MSPQVASTACTVAPQRSITSFIRVPKTPLTQTMTSSPGSIRLTTHSMPAMPVPLTGNVSGFFVRKTCRSNSQVSSMIAMYCGSRWPMVGAASARRTRCETGLGPDQKNALGRIQRGDWRLSQQHEVG